MTIPALQLAAEIVRRSPTSQTNLTVQKLAYFCHGWSLALAGEPLVDGPFEAWRLGPVLPDLYHTLKMFSANSIPKNHPLMTSQPTLAQDDWQASLIDRVLEVYGDLSSAALVNQSHLDGSPWEASWKEGGRHAWISNESIRTYFQQLAAQKA